jgi:multiple sugar transport system ATP-binding protein
MRLGTTFIYVTHDQVEAMTMATRIAVMRDGILQQLDTPQHLYDRPGNVFVAGFIGSPSMNFFDTTLVESDGRLWVDGGTFRLEVPESTLPALLPYRGKEVIFGVRPEDIHAKPFVPTSIIESDMKADVDVTELMGNEIFLYLLSGQKSFIARVDPRVSVKPSDQIDLAVNMANMHVYDRDTELAIV